MSLAVPALNLPPGRVSSTSLGSEITKKPKSERTPVRKKEDYFGVILFDLFVDRVATKRRIILLLLNPLRNGFLISRSEVFGGILTLAAGFGALDNDVFLHGLKVVKPSEETLEAPLRNSKVRRAPLPDRDHR